MSVARCVYVWVSDCAQNGLQLIREQWWKLCRVKYFEGIANQGSTEVNTNCCFNCLK